MRLPLLIIISGLLLVGVPMNAHAQEMAAGRTAQTLVLRTGVHENFDRLAFDGARGMAYKVKREDSKVAVTFYWQATVNLSQASHLTRAHTFATSREERDGKPVVTVSFVVDPKAVIKDFVSGPTIVFDIYDGPTAPASVKEASPSGQPKQAKAEIVKKATEPSGEKLQPKPEPPKAEPPKPVEPNPAEIKFLDSKPPEKAAPSGAEAPKPRPAKIEPVKTETLKPLEPAEPAKTEAPAPASAVDVKKPAPVLPNFDIGSTPELVATLDPKVALGAVIFVRGGYVTILFDRKLTMDRAVLTGSVPPRVTLDPIDLPKNNGFRFAVPEGVDVEATRIGTIWKIFLVRKKTASAVSTSFVPQPDFALGARLLLPTIDGPDPVKYTDPVVGDELIVVPLRETSAFSIPRRLADFVIIPAAQGLVIKPLHEKVTVRTYAEGIEVTAEGGLKLSPANDTGVSQKVFKKGSTKYNKTVFDLALWAGKPSETFTSIRQRLSQTVVDVPETQRNLARLELARFYFAHGMGEETLALLSVIAKQSPDIAAHPEFLALRGAARILVGHPQEGLNDLNDPALSSQYEIALWQALGAAEMRDWAMAEEKFSYTEDLWNTYAEPYHSRFAVLAIESALSLDKDREGAEWLDRLENQQHLPEIDPAIKYLRGVLQSKSGHAELADKLWREVAHSNDRLYKIRAELALIDLGVATRSMTPAQAIERLEGLRFAWRGDDLEVDILRRLGNFYIETKNFKAGLAVLQQATRLYPTSPLTPPIREEMAKTFHDVYMTDLGSKLSPVEALTMYEDYRDLIPQGEEGNALKRNLAERLVAIDLLEQAAGLLEEQIKGGLKGEERVRTGTRLAAIRLLDHKPDKALADLELSQADLPASPAAQELQNERQLLRARAVSEQGKYDEALALLQNNASKGAKVLHADITMRAQRWGEAAKVLLDLVGPPPKPGEQLTDEQAQWLVNCAIATSLAGDTSMLDKLAIDFGAAMAGTMQKDMFTVLTRPDKSTPMKDIAAAQAKITEVDMFRGFLDTYRGQGK